MSLVLRNQAYTIRKLDALPSVEEALKYLAAIGDRDETLCPRKIAKPLALYGAGDLGRMSYSYFRSLGIPVSFAVDRKADDLSADSQWSGVRLITPDEATAAERDACILAVCISTAPYVAIKDELRSQGWKDVVPVYDIVEAYRDRHPLSNGWFADPPTKEQLGDISAVLSGWSDDVSRAHHLQFIAWRRLRQEWVFNGAPVEVSNRYFIPEVTEVLRNDERFMDVGAYDGRVISRFLDLTDDNCDRICAVEPDRWNRSLLENSLKALGSESLGKVTVISHAVGEDCRDARFVDGLGYASQLSDLGSTTVQVATIDKLRFNPSFIKLHLEGGELAALKGALQTMQESRPIIAATTYHNSHGLSALPHLLMKCLPNYRFMMRLHGWVGTAAVLYGIPGERTVLRKPKTSCSGAV